MVGMVPGARDNDYEARKNYKPSCGDLLKGVTASAQDQSRTS
jgi:hypothetical protein